LEIKPKLHASRRGYDSSAPHPTADLDESAHLGIGSSAVTFGQIGADASVSGLSESLTAKSPLQILPRQLLYLAGRFQFEHGGEDFRRRELGFQLLDDLVQMHGLVGPSAPRRSSFFIRRG
jgi:hypothetical protein